MIITFQVVLILIMIVGLIGAIGEKENHKLQANMATLLL